jgi:DNA-binding XRE family transcriptional regulator
MTSDAERIKGLRERTGKSSNEIAAIAGLGEMEYFDLESHDDELVTVPSLAKIRRLAEALGVPTSTLFCDDPNSVHGHTSYAELVSLVMARLAAGISREALEEEIGWDLDAFLESEQRALSEYGVEFLQALCPCVGAEWMAALP